MLTAMRRWLRRPPSRAELRGEADLWMERCRRSNEERDAARERAEQADQLVARLQQQINAGLNEPDRVEGCDKIRFHRWQEAEDWRVELAYHTDQNPDALHAYDCKVCPRSPITMRRYFHVGHPARRVSQREKRAAQGRRAGERIEARREGRLINQQVDPLVLAKLKQIQNGGEGS